jgi:hypothetical protein
MGVKNSKPDYACNPLPWPESLQAFRLIDQVWMMIWAAAVSASAMVARPCIARHRYNDAFQ